MILSASLSHNPSTTANLKSDLQFLNHGTRSYSCQSDGTTTAIICLGDLVYLDS